MARCRLYPVAPDGDDIAAGIAALRQAAADADIAALLIPESLAANPRAGELVAAAQSLSIAAIIEKDAGAARRLKADGVEVEGIPAFKAAREMLGPQAIIGGRARASRHEAMSLGEAGADYVSLAPDLVEWWAGLFEPPCVCEAPLSAAEAPEIIAAGADFIRPQSLAEAPSLSRLIAEN